MAAPFMGLASHRLVLILGLAWILGWLELLGDYLDVA